MTTAVYAPSFYDHGSVGAGTSTPEISKGSYHRITCTAGTRTIAAPVVSAVSRYQGQAVDVADPIAPGAEDADLGSLLLIEVRATGGTLTLTWNAVFKGAPGSIANGQRRIIPFVWDGAAWVVMNAGADVPN